LTSIGRASTNTIPLPDETASLEHALITHRNGKWWLEDLDSRNGTTLNGQAVTTPTVVSTGDVVGLGRTQFKLEVE
ncbi:MAG: putative domain containing protein, partial [Anaerolineales bacterium]|nr:putative domain containing protein [Anaerolineales bacterium]